MRSMKKIRPAGGAMLAAGSMLFLGASLAPASPFFAIGEGTDTPWSAALSSGMIRPVVPGQDQFTGAAMMFYNENIGQGEFAMVDAILTPDIMTDLGGETHESLVMQWNPDASVPVSVAAWQFDYGQDPDLSGASIHFSLGVPGQPNGAPAIWDVSIELIDEAGNSRGWFMPDPPVGWNEFWLDVDQGPQGGWQFFQDPDFDISSVVSIRLDEAGAMVEFPAPPPGTNPDIWDWNAWNHLSVVPSPGAAGLLALAGLGVVVRRRR